MYSIQQDDGSSIVYANDGLQASESAAEIRAAAGMSGVLQVAAMGDLDGDGFDEVAVTGLAEDLRGTTYIVSGSDWGEFSNLSDVETVILGEVDGAMSAFVAGNADFDGDGRADVLRGTPNLYAGLPGFAEVYVGGVPRQSSEPWLKIAAQAVGDAFGVGVSFADLDGDGAVDVAIGAPLRVGTAPGDGAVTFLYGPYSGTVDAELLPTIMGPTPDGTFGEAVLACQLDSLSANELLVLGEGGAHLIAGKGE
jgi:hypothetical protein